MKGGRMPRAALAPARRPLAGGLARALALGAFLLGAVPLSAPLHAEEGGAPGQSFGQWLDGLRREALAAGISKATLDRALSGLRPNPKVVELDRSQPEFTMTFDDYLARVVSDERVQRGQALLAQHRVLLEEVGAKYGVHPRFIVALWSVESNYGTRTGEFPVIESLATLAYEGRRAKFFRKELLAALKIVQQDKLDPAMMLGSWSGAMGQSQFIPSSFQNFAVDYDRDGRRDIWGTPADVFASIANYLSRNRWRSGQSWGREVQLPPGFDPGLLGPKQERKLAEWQQLGLRTANGATLPVVKDMTAYLLQPGGEGGRAFLVYANFKTILRWNRSDFFGTAVGLLADRIGAG
ncbi:MAG: lytic murein transglycosylase [Rhodospirillaceae bacterium]|nr:lytic murein transglycosylase [Rhodospirillaceae bacterium]